MRTGPATNLLAELNITLPSPIIDMKAAPESWFAEQATDTPTMYMLRLQAERLHVTAGFDRLICLDDISVDHYQHQLEAALRALRDMRGQALLADEVGLGKTIEAGIVMKELIERGLARRILIITPASLTWQWHEEMDTKFHEAFTVLEELEQLPDPPSDPESCRWLISLSRARSPRWSERLLAQEYDLLIIDEAHKLKNHRTKAYKFVSQIRKQYVLMLTATPVHNDLLELYNLINILRPGHLGTRSAFRKSFRVPPPSGYKTFLVHNFHKEVEAYLRQSYQERQEYRQDQEKSRWMLARTEDIAELDQLTGLGRWGEIERKEIKSLLSQGYQAVEFEAVTHQPDGWHIRGQTRTSFYCRLRLDTQYRQSSAQNPAALRRLLREVMLRNRRSNVGVRFPPRRAAVYTLDLTPPERKLYDGVTAYIREQLHEARRQTAAARKRSRSTGPLQMTLMSLQKQLCSSPQAAARILQKLVDRYPDDSRLAEYLVLAWGLERGRKIEATLFLLENYPGKFLIFTDYVPTLQALHTALTQAGHETVVFHGGLSTLERVEAVRSFRHTARVMISTQSGSEGHNLQFCHQLINYDLPWNPMRIEQRVGRLHRLGQQETVSIFNLAANDTIEAYVLNLLAHKIRMFELVIGELDLILGQLGDEQGFEQYIEKAWADSQSEDELLQMIAELEGLLDQSKQAYGQIRSASDELADLLETFDEVHR